MRAWVWWGYGGNSSPHCCLLVSVALKRQTDPPWAPAWVLQWAHAEQTTFTIAFSQQGLKSVSPGWFFWLSSGTGRKPLSLWGRGMVVNLHLGGHCHSLRAPVWAVPSHKDASCITRDPIPYLLSTPSSSCLILPLPSNNHLGSRHPSSHLCSPIKC